MTHFVFLFSVYSRTHKYRYFIKMAVQNPPLPTKRTKIFSVVDNVWKSNLIESFEGFNASQVSQHHIEMAEACIKNGGSKNERYRLVPFERILTENQVRDTHTHTSLYIITHTQSCTRTLKW